MQQPIQDRSRQHLASARQNGAVRGPQPEATARKSGCRLTRNVPRRLTDAAVEQLPARNARSDDLAQDRATPLEAASPRLCPAIDTPAAPAQPGKHPPPISARRAGAADGLAGRAGPLIAMTTSACPAPAATSAAASSV